MKISPYLVQTLDSTGAMVSCVLPVCRVHLQAAEGTVIAGATDGSLKMLRGEMQADPYEVINTPSLQFLGLFLLLCTLSSSILFLV